MAISFDLPQDIAEELRAAGVDMAREAKVAYLVELYRQERISHAQLREALGVSFYEAEGLIKERGAGQDISVEEFEAGREWLREALARPMDKTVGGIFPVPWKTASETTEQD